MRISLSVWILLLAAGTARGEPVSRCLPVEAGQEISRLVDSGKIQKLVGQEWSLDSANIEVSRLVLTLKAASGLKLGVILSSGGPGETRGRWFSYGFFNSQGPPRENQLLLLLQAATLIDEAFESSPWVACLEAPGSDDLPPDGLYLDSGTGPAEARPAVIPAWLYLVLGICQFLVILLGLASALWNRTPPPVRSRP